MLPIVNEPQAAYVQKWTIRYRGPFIEDSISDIKDGIIIMSSPSISIFNASSAKTKKKLSTLRGKTSKQSSKEIEEQISSLRDEWERNF